MLPLLGDQALVDRLRLMLPVPVFLTYTVWVVLEPAAMDPQFTVLRALVHALSEYTPMFGVVVIVPVLETSLVIVIAAKVEAVNTKAATAIITGNSLVYFDMLRYFTQLTRNVY